MKTIKNIKEFLEGLITVLFLIICIIIFFHLCDKIGSYLFMPFDGIGVSGILLAPFIMVAIIITMIGSLTVSMLVTGIGLSVIRIPFYLLEKLFKLEEPVWLLN